MKILKKTVLASLAGLSSLTYVSLLVAPVHGVEFRTGENVSVGKAEVVDDDLYLTGDTMTVSGRVTGDVVAAGRVLTIEGVVEGDLIAAAQAIVIEGEVADDVRIAGMTLQLTDGARVGDDLFAAGFSLESGAGSLVVGKTGFTGYQAVLGGEHRQGLEASLVGLRLSGLFGGDVDATVESEAGASWWTRFMRSPVALPVVEPGLTVTDDARILGDLRYKSVAEAVVGSSDQVEGEIRRSTPRPDPVERPDLGSRLAGAVRWLVVLFLVGSTLLWLIPDKFLGVADTVASRPVVGLGWGVVTLLAFPVAMLLILVLSAVATMAFGMLTLGQAAVLVLILGLLAEVLLAAKLWMAVFYLVPAIVSFAAGRWLLTRGGAGEKSRYLSLLTGLSILSALTLIPYLGFLVKMLVVVVGLGAAALWSVRYLAMTEVD